MCEISIALGRAITSRAFIFLISTYDVMCFLKHVELPDAARQPGNYYDVLINNNVFSVSKSLFARENRMENGSALSRMAVKC